MLQSFKHHATVHRNCWNRVGCRFSDAWCAQKPIRSPWRKDISCKSSPTLSTYILTWETLFYFSKHIVHLHLKLHTCACLQHTHTHAMCTNIHHTWHTYAPYTWHTTHDTTHTWYKHTYHTNTHMNTILYLSAAIGQWPWLLARWYRRGTAHTRWIWFRSWVAVAGWGISRWWAHGVRRGCSTETIPNTTALLCHSAITPPCDNPQHHCIALSLSHHTSLWQPPTPLHCSVTQPSHLPVTTPNTTALLCHSAISTALQGDSKSYPNLCGTVLDQWYQQKL